MNLHCLLSGSALALAVALSLATLSPVAVADTDFAPIKAQITVQHDANVQRLKDWIALPSIAAEEIGRAHV